MKSIVRKGEIACNKQFFLFSLFSTLYVTFPFYMHFKMSSAVCFNLDQSKILPSGNGLTLYFQHYFSYTAAISNTCSPDFFFYTITPLNIRTMSLNVFTYYHRRTMVTCETEINPGGINIIEKKNGRTRDRNSDILF